MKVKSDFKTDEKDSRVDLFLEAGLPIVEFRGDYYWIGEEDPPEGFVCESCELESSAIPAIRRYWGLSEGESYFYSDMAKEGALEYRGGRFVDDENGFMPDSERRFYKAVLNYDQVSDPFVREYLLFSLEHEKHVCIKNGCEDCSFLDNCVVDLIFK